ncbi:MAG: hypothetical protein WD046_08810 [Paracoccaceae bacterium]
MVILTFWRNLPPLGFGVNVCPWLEMVKTKGDSFNRVLSARNREVTAACGFDTLLT